MPTLLRSADESAFSLLWGGFTRCDKRWKKQADGRDQCYKLYFLKSGQGRLELQGQSLSVRAGRAYFIPGYQLVRQSCPDHMEVHWVHFVPTSLYLAHQMSHVTQVHQWSLREVRGWRGTYEAMPDLFQQPPRWLHYRAQAMILDLVSRVFELYDFSHMASVDPLFEQLQPAIAFMEEHLLENPKLAEIAKVVHLAPNYFHRKFSALFHMTPLAYMLGRRLDLARQLLLSTDLTLEKVAHRSGFQNAFYLSRVFKREYGVSPSEYRKRAGP